MSNKTWKQVEVGGYIMTSQEFKKKNLAVGNTIGLRLLSASSADEEFLINGGTVRIVSINHDMWWRFWEITSINVMLARFSGHGDFRINLSNIKEMISWE
ncbi:MAG: hypothetical protein WC244_04675 [Patescibacteria group bacterium]